MRVAITFVVCLCGCLATAAAQTPQTREETLRQQREAKAASLTPNKLTGLQKALTFVEERSLLLLARDGFHPKLGSLATGSGFAMGVGYRNRDVFKRYGVLETFAAGSLRKYWAIESQALFPDLARGHIVAEAVASLREYPQEKFFGLGPDARRADQTSFLLRTARAGGRAAVKLAPVASIGGGLDYLTPRIGRGRASGMPSTEDLFTAPSVPGLTGHADFLRSWLFAEVDYRQPRNARQGGLYRIERSHYDDRTSGAFTFNRTDIDLRQYLGFLAGRRVIALRGVLSTTEAADGADVPFYLMPFLGGKDSLRGFRDYRFRGPHSLLLQGEYRWEIWSGLEGALFYDTGKVAMERRDLGVQGLQHAYGFGFRFNTDEAVVMRVDAAFGSIDGKHLHISFGGTF